MSPEDRLQITQALETRRAEIADRWYRALSRTGFTGVSREKARQLFRALTEQAIAFVVTEPLEREQARDIGSTLVDLHFVQPDSLGATQEVLARELTVGLTPLQVAALQPNLAALLGDVATGFYAQARAMILKEQEQIRRALFVARLHAEEARAATEAALQVRNNFLSAVSHDLRLPLTTISGRAQLLQLQSASLDDAERIKWTSQLSSITKASTKMARMIDDLLDLTRLQAGEGIQLNRQETDLVALSGEVADEFRQITSRHRITVEAAVPAIVGNWDRSRLERVIGNLLSNAIKYSPGEGDITLRVYQNGDMAGIAVQDQGQGIPASDLAHLFDWYRRAQNVGRTAGMGIGLAVVRQIVEQHSGKVSVHSQPGIGTTVTVSLPLAAVVGHEDQEAIRHIPE